MDPDIFFDQVMPILGICAICISVLVTVTLLVVVYKHGKKKGVSNLWIWLVFVLLWSIPAALIYYLVNRNKVKSTAAPRSKEEPVRSEIKPASGDKTDKKDNEKATDAGTVKKGGWKNNKLIAAIAGIITIIVALGGLGLLFNALGINVLGWIGLDFVMNPCTLPSSVSIQYCYKSSNPSSEKAGYSWCFIDTGTSGDWDLNGTNMHSSGTGDGLIPNSCLKERGISIP